MANEDGLFVEAGKRGSLGRNVPTNVGPYLVSFRLMAGDTTLWGNRVINFGVSPDAETVRVDEQIPLPQTAGRMILLGLTDLAMVSRHQGSLRVRYHSMSCEVPAETHEFGLTGPRRIASGADIKGLEFELGRYTGYSGITIIDISVVES